MNDKDTKWCPAHGYPLPCAKCGLGEVAAALIAERKKIGAWLDPKRNPKTLEDWMAGVQALERGESPEAGE